MLHDKEPGKDPMKGCELPYRRRWMLAATVWAFKRRGKVCMGDPDAYKAELIKAFDEQSASYLELIWNDVITDPIGIPHDQQLSPNIPSYNMAF